MNSLPQYVVVDTSVAIKWLSEDGEESVPQAVAVLDRLFEGNIVLLVPELQKYEVGNALLSKKLPEVMYLELLKKYAQIPMTFLPQDEKLQKLSATIAIQTPMTYYDASFVAVADYYGIPLITANAKHQSKWQAVRVIDVQDIETD